MDKVIKLKDKTYFQPYFPIGSIYINVNDTNPTVYFGGTWEQIQDVFLLACGKTYVNGTVGGEATHKLTVDEMPKHNHAQGLAGGDIINGGNAAYSWSIPTYRYIYNGEDLALYSGEDLPHNNMPPYLAVYVWKRIA